MYFLGGILSVCFNIVFVLFSLWFLAFYVSCERTEKTKWEHEGKKTMQRTFRMYTIISLKAKRRIRVQ